MVKTKRRKYNKRSYNKRTYNKRKHYKNRTINKGTKMKKRTKNKRGGSFIMTHLPTIILGLVDLAAITFMTLYDFGPSTPQVGVTPSAQQHFLVSSNYG